MEIEITKSMKQETHVPLGALVVRKKTVYFEVDRDVSPFTTAYEVAKAPLTEENSHSLYGAYYGVFTNWEDDIISNDSSNTDNLEVDNKLAEQKEKV